MKIKSIVLSNGLFDTKSAKTAHGLIRGSERYEIVAVIDEVFFGRDAGIILDGRSRNIPIYKDVITFIQSGGQARNCIVGVAPKGGQLPISMEADVMEAMKNGMDVVSGLHSFLHDNPRLAECSQKYKVIIHDIRQPTPRHKLRFWTGEIYQIPCAKIAVMGTDCGLGKRTTAKFIVESIRQEGMISEMIYTGQTGWMQGWKYGFILDSTYNDYVSGELERSIVSCYKEVNPSLIVIEGQAALRNISGPCGAEFLVSGDVDGVILQHAPARKYYDGFEDLGKEIPNIADEIKLIGMYGKKVLGITLNTHHLSQEQAHFYKQKYAKELGIPVCLPIEEGVAELIPVLKELIIKKKKETKTQNKL
ncbi:MAG: DUF1611 domain-containing protein [Chitinophagaceae bacterium]|nr:DUF1611 domain-containing protein [Chitinophagaceae bacterium]